MNNNTSRTVFIAVLITLVVGAFMYYKKNPNTVSDAGTTLENTPDETSSWKTYANSDLGFSLSYPENWRTVDRLNAQNSGTLQLFNYSADKYVGGEMMKTGDIKIEAVVLPKTKLISLQDYVKHAAESGLGANKEHIYGKIQLKNVEALTDEIKDDSSYKSYYVELKNNKVLLITSSPNTLDTQAVLIISSLQVEK